MSDNAPKKKCFVVMGFGKKTDFQSGRVLDLDKTYRIIIKKAVEAAGVECIRADDVIHAGLIDRPMYKLLLEADLVVADLSTSNVNAVYELGVRHALRPHTTIVIAESKFKFPFDLNSLLIRPYEHLGPGIDAEEADRVRDELTNAIKTLMDTPETDSPVHMFLPELNDTAGAPPPEEAKPADDTMASVLWESYFEARAEEDFLMGQAYLKKLLKKFPNDPYAIQQLAIATYKGKEPDAKSSLKAAKKILQPLAPETTNDTETLGIWGAIHKRLWESDKNREDLDTAIDAHQKGFQLANDYYNGINYAFLLNVRAKESEAMDAITDYTLAQRIRRKTIEICEELLKAEPKDDQGNPDKEQLFWLRATTIEARLGLGEDVDDLIKKAVADAPESWMGGTMEGQLKTLRDLLKDSPEHCLKS